MAQGTTHQRWDGGARREAELAARWAAGEWRGQALQTERGERYRLIFEGRRGGGAGPDFRDAVLERPDGTRLRGDVELHLRAADWQAHGHGGDPRYNAVVLHVVLASNAAESPLASGAVAPVVVLRSPIIAGGTHLSPWPCAGLLASIGHKRMRRLLVDAGRERFHGRAAALGSELGLRHPRDERETVPRWTYVDRVLFIALAEALGYGRDRAALRQAGERLADGDLPEAVLADGEWWSRVERLRLRGLVARFERWRAPGPWHALLAMLGAGSPRGANYGLVTTLSVTGGCVSPGRARILAANVVLPFAAAYADATGDQRLAARARELYAALPGLPANQITREMRRQLGLPRQPSGAAAQQGLHHIWSTWCRDKRCAACPCNIQRLTTETTEWKETKREGREGSQSDAKATDVLR
jgi:hypothetical protein